MEVIDPAGGVIPLATGIPLVFGPQNFFLAAFAPLPLPPVTPAFVGFPYRFRITARDPMTGAYLDGDEFEYIVQ